MKLNKMIDHTLLKPEATETMIKKLCAEAIEYDFATVCVNPYWVNYCKTQLKNTNVGITTVVGFPLGAMTTKGKMEETKDALGNGASEIDMVLNIGALKSGDYETVFKDISQIVMSASPQIVKVILETSLLTEGEIVKACQLAEKAGAAYIKTSTGFSSSGASVENVKLMKNSVSEKVKVKASGGIRDLNTAKKMIEVGASRLGVSAGVEIMKEEQQ